MTARNNHTWIISILLLVYVCTQSYCIYQPSINYDEESFANYGTTILKFQREKDVIKYESKLPITALNMLPRAFEQIIHPGLSKQGIEEDLIRGRFVSLIATVILSLVIYYWSLQLYGKGAAIFSFCFFLLCPNFLAHGIFVSSDIFACLFMTLSLLFLWKFSRSYSKKYFVFASTFVALSLISKFSMVHLIFIFFLLFGMNVFYPKKVLPTGKVNLKNVLYLLFIFIGINWFIISAAHLFFGMFIPLNNYTFTSSTFQSLQSLFYGIGDYLPLPLPSAYIRSMDAVIYFDKLGGGMPGSLNGPPYVLGTNSNHGFWYYFFVVLFYKLPLSVLLLVVATFFVYFLKPDWKSFFQKEIYLIVPVVYFMIYLSFFYHTQVGIRHILMIIPLLFIFFGFFFKKINSIAGYCFVLLLLTYQFISVGKYFPHFLPYTNEFIPDKKFAYKKIGDTNLCYGEGQKFLQRYLHEHKDAKYVSDSIVPGTVVIELNDMLNLNMAKMGKYDWVKHLEPIDHIHSQYYVFVVTPGMADSLKRVFH